MFTFVGCVQLGLRAARKIVCSVIGCFISYLVSYGDFDGCSAGSSRWGNLFDQEAARILVG